ncbi:hypothetical protein JTB14_029608 [Gonioctena quinquepunctata]|nr:hypothetical protein JTB14_029608 [Gonioctena quinquepunctata]
MYLENRFKEEGNQEAEQRTLSHSLQLPEFQTLKPWQLQKNPARRNWMWSSTSFQKLESGGIPPPTHSAVHFKKLLDKINMGQEERYSCEPKSFYWSEEEPRRQVPSGDQKVVLCKRILLENKKSLESK